MMKEEMTEAISPEEAQAERIRRALKEVQFCDSLPIARQCAICEQPMDRPSAIIMDVRNKVEHLISHSYHEKCYEDWLNGEVIT